VLDAYQELKDRFSYHKPDEAKVHIHEQVRAACFELAVQLIQLVPECDERDEALKHVESAMFYGNAGVARHIEPQQGNPTE
jgi:hypothetical protein